MKSLNKIFAGMTLAMAAMSSQAAILQPTTGNGELTVVLYNGASNNSFLVDLGKTLSSFNTTLNQTFSLSSSPYYSTFLTNVGAGLITFGVFGGDNTGLTAVADDKNLWVTSAANSTPPSPTNANLSTRIGALNTYQQAHNGVSSGPLTSNHSTLTDGSSISVAANTTSSFSTLNNGVVSPSGVTMVAVGGQAELFKIATATGSAATAIVTDFFSDTETPSNLGGYFTVDLTSGNLNYFGAPTTVVPPIPEASEWAMMLSGLGMLGLMVRRRRNNI
jgi:hypothetical protein